MVEGVARILLADEQSLFREAVKVVLSAEEDLVVVAEAKDGLEALTEAIRTMPDVALLDAGLPNCDGVKATALIKEKVPGCRIVVLSDEEDLNTLLEALEAGANGYLSKGSPLADLIEFTREIAKGETLIPPRMLGPMLSAMIDRKREHEGALRRVAQLTRREREVLAQLADGADNGSIAQALVISPETARTHIQNVLGKLGVHSRLAAAAFVTRHGIMDELVAVDA